MRSRRNASAEPPRVRRLGVARVLSKRGLCSRTQAAAWVAAGRVRVNGRVVHDPEAPVRDGVDRVEVDGQAAAAAGRVVVMLNKPRGLVTTARDERGRDTVYACLDDPSLPWLAPVGRLDKASEGLLLFANDSEWAAGVASPDTGPPKTYHVQIDRVPDDALLSALTRGVVDDGETLRARSATCLRSGAKHAWLEIVLDEGRNRQIRRLLAALDVAVLRLVRVAIGPLVLGTLPKGRWRRLTAAEADALLTAPDRDTGARGAASGARQRR
jgi:23S rRNA pseudouridine2605 synthase